MINLRVETLIQPVTLPIERFTYAQSQNLCSKHVYEVYMYIAKNFCHEGATVSLFICCCVRVEFLSSHNCKVCTVVSLHNATLATAIQGTFS